MPLRCKCCARRRWRDATAYDDCARKQSRGFSFVLDGDFVGARRPTRRLGQRALDRFHAQWKEVQQISKQGRSFPISSAQACRETDDRLPEAKRFLWKGRARAAASPRATYNVAYIATSLRSSRAGAASVGRWKLTVWTSARSCRFQPHELAYVLPHSRERRARDLPDTGSAYGGSIPRRGARTPLAWLVLRRPLKVVWTREENSPGHISGPLLSSK